LRGPRVYRRCTKFRCGRLLALPELYIPLEESAIFWKLLFFGGMTIAPSAFAERAACGLPKPVICPVCALERRETRMATPEWGRVPTVIEIKRPRNV
jgi:hypothetical protein